uniref:Uncharacterized protein n=1 Tax=Hyaloperonospora arabidopsidis (strain Emoy2) TaxID=559515 RepID=M4BLH8_HYAAE
MSSQTQGTLAISSNTGIGHDDGVVEVPSPHGTGGSLARQATPVAVCVSAAAHEALVHECTLDEVQARLLTLETCQKRTEVQLDFLIRIHQPVERPTSAAKAPPDQPGTDLDTA